MKVGHVRNQLQTAVAAALLAWYDEGIRAWCPEGESRLWFKAPDEQRCSPKHQRRSSELHHKQRAEQSVVIFAGPARATKLETAELKGIIRVP
jgi:hypothetical protein